MAGDIHTFPPRQPLSEPARAPSRREADTLAMIARQPVFDSGLRVVGYELLFRGGDPARARVRDPVQATAAVVMGAALDIGFQRLVGDLDAYINFPPAMLDPDVLPALDPTRVVIEVAADATGPDLGARLQRLRDLRYRIALDNCDARIVDSPLLAHADLVKINARALTGEELGRCVRALRRRPLRLLAARLETREELEASQALGFDLFQGFFVEKPQIVSARRPPGARLATLQLILRLHDPDVSIEEIEAWIARDVGLSYRILRCINSSFYQMPRRVDSIREATLLLGLSELRRLCWLMLLAGIGDQPAHLCVQALQRARMCEGLADAADLPGGASFFMTGMLSLVDTLLGMPMADALALLPLEERVNEALLGRRGDLGLALRCVENYERGDWGHIGFRDLPAGTIAAAYLQAAGWADHAWKQFQAI